MKGAIQIRVAPFFALGRAWVMAPDGVEDERIVLCWVIGRGERNLYQIGKNQVDMDGGFGDD